MNGIEFKNLIAKVGEVEVRSMTVAGYFAKFGNVDYDDDIIERGAFTKTISERGPGGTNQIMHLLNHDSWSPLAKPNVLKEDDFGLYFESPFPDTTMGVDTVKLYAAGVYNEHSIGFNTIQYEVNKNQDTGKEVRIIKEVKLWEGSTVTWGANDQTPFVGFKGVDRPEMVDRMAERLERIAKALTDNKFSEITKNQLEFEIQVLAKIMKSLKDEEPPVLVTPTNTFKPTSEDVVRKFLQSLEQKIN